MQIIKPSVEILTHGDETADILRHIELCGRVCYKSEDKIGEDTAEAFVKNIIQRGHESVLEHGSLVVYAFRDAWTVFKSRLDALRGYGEPSYLRVTADDANCAIISGNIRAWRTFLQNCVDYGLSIPHCLDNFIADHAVFFPEFHREKKEDRKDQCVTICRETAGGQGFREAGTHYDVSLRFICDRGISHEFVRHRVFSPSQESTRYCNYSKGQFGSEITVIEPCFLEPGSGGYATWKESCLRSESAYFHLLDWGLTPQEARDVLPTSLKTEFILTGTLKQWWAFLRLRNSEAAHPQAREVAEMAKAILTEKFPTYFYESTGEEEEEEEENNA